MSSLPLAVLLAVFVGAGAAVWVAGIKLPTPPTSWTPAWGWGRRSAGWSCWRSSRTCPRSPSCPVPPWHRPAPSREAGLPVARWVSAYSAPERPTEV